MLDPGTKRIGVLGDVHSEHAHLQAAISHLESLGVDMFICTGDLADGQGDLARCVELLTANDVVTVRGNHDRWVLENKARHVPHAHQRRDLDDGILEYLASMSSTATLATPLGQLLLCHGVGNNDLKKIWPGTERMPIERCDRLDKIIAQDEIAIMINGHVHYRTLIHFENMLLLNAGTLKRDHRPGFSLLDLANGELTGFELTPEPREVKKQPLAPQAGTRVFGDTRHFDGKWVPVTLYA